MKLIVNPHKIEIDKSPVNEREIDITKCEFEFADEITNDYVKEAYFTFNGTSYKEIIVNNQCAIPSEVLAKKGQVEIGVVAFLVENEEEIKRYNPSPAYFNTWLGSLKDNAENSEPITPSEMEQFEQALNDGLNEVANVDIDAEQLDNGMSVTITNRYGEDKTVYAYDGEKGETGATPNIQIGTVVTGNHSEVTRTGTNENPIFNFVLEKGDKGDTGNGIASVTKTSTSGLVDTYTITYTNGTTTTFNVTNGKGITNIAKTSTSGLEDTYTITYNDNTTSTFTVTNGNGISSIEKTGTQDNVDTYTIYYTNGTTSTFTVTNSTVTNQEFEELKAEHEELVNTLPRVEGTGESITLDNTAQYKMNVALSGNTSQVQYTGKNLLNTQNWVGGYIDSSGNLHTGNTNALFDGYIEVNSNTQYVISTNTSIRNVAISEFDSSQTFIQRNQSGNNVSLLTITTTANTKYVRVQFNYDNSTTITQTIIDGLELQLESGSSRTSYEPYVGGVPSPNPLYPQPIKKVTGNNSITVCGKNLVSSLNKYNNNVYFNGYTSQQVYPFKAGTYTLSYKNTNNLSTYMKVQSGTQTNLGQNKTITFTANENFNIWFYRSGITIEEFSEVQLEHGSTATTYEPYQSQTYPINLGSLEYCKIGNYSDEIFITKGKNLFDKDNANILSAYINEINSTIIGSSKSKTIYIKCNPNTTYTISKTVATSRFVIGTTTNIPDLSAICNQVIANNNATSITITTGINDNYLCAFIYHSDTDSSLTLEQVLSYIQIEKGSIATPYEPYGIGNWYIRRNISKVILNGTEIWTNMGWAPPKYAFRVTISDIKQTTGGTRPPNCMSDYYKSDSYNNMQNSESKYGLANRNNQPQIVFRNDDYSTATDFKEWLTTHNTTVYYILATPTSEAITDTTLINQLNNLYNQIKSYKEQTNITQTNAELPFNIDASALYDLNNLISRVATLETEV